MPPEPTSMGASHVSWRRGNQSNLEVAPRELFGAARANSSRLRLRLTRLMAVSILALFCFGTTYWSVANPLVERTLFIVGICLAGFGATGRAWATAYISGHKQKELITTGPYSLCRNPLYFFSMILGVGFGFCTKTFTGAILIFLVLAILYYFQIRREEVRLRSQFGAIFDAYTATIPRFLPSFHGYTEPDEITISPRLLKKGLFGIAFLLMLIAALEIIQGLHFAGLLPNYFRIY